MCFFFFTCSTYGIFGYLQAISILTKDVLTFDLLYTPDQLLISSPKRLCSDCFQTKDTFKQEMRIFQAY